MPVGTQLASCCRVDANLEAAMNFHETILEIQEDVDDEKEILFLRLLAEQAHGSPDEPVNAGEAAEVMQLPYEEVLRMADELEEDYFLRRVGPTNAPNGPVVCLTRAGLRAAGT